MKTTVLKCLKGFAAGAVLMAASASAVDVQIDGGDILLGSDISSITVDPTTGKITIITISGDWNITQEVVDPGDPVPVVSLQVNGSSSAEVDQGTPVTISWNVSDAASCDTLNGNVDWDGTVITLVDGASNSSANITIDYIGTVNFTLRCVNGVNTTSRSVSVTGVDPNQQGPVGACPDGYAPTLAGDIYTWERLIGDAWPDPTLREKTISIRDGGYLAIEFNTGSFVGDGGVKTISHISTNGSRLGAFSACAGDFSEHLPDAASACRRSWYIGGTLNWSTESFSESWECLLEPNTTYYLNLTFTDGVSASTDQCDSTDGVCRTIIRVFH